MLARVAEVLAWWAVLLGAWLMSLNAFSFAELTTAACVALPGALAACAARRAVGGRWHVRVRWARWLRFAPWAILHDTVSVLRLAAGPDRPDDDSFDEVELTRAEDGHEAFATALVSAAPGSVVVDADHRRLLVHRPPIGDTGLTGAVRR
jgi:multisubunit Na+/H+ antiporter MnhE subunit